MWPPKGTGGRDSRKTLSGEKEAVTKDTSRTKKTERRGALGTQDYPSKKVGNVSGKGVEGKKKKKKRGQKKKARDFGPGEARGCRAFGKGRKRSSKKNS